MILFTLYISNILAQTVKTDTTKYQRKTLKLITNKSEFEKHFKDTASYLQLEKEVLFPQTNVYISPPKYFKPVENIHGFIHIPTMSSMTCTEIKGYHYTQLTEQLTSEYIASQNATLNSTEDIILDNQQPARLFYISFTIPAKDSLHKDTPFERLMLFTGDMENTIWINVTYPQAVKRFVHNIILKSLKTVHFRKNE